MSSSGRQKVLAPRPCRLASSPALWRAGRVSQMHSPARGSSVIATCLQGVEDGPGSLLQEVVCQHHAQFLAEAGGAADLAAQDLAAVHAAHQAAQMQALTVAAA